VMLIKPETITAVMAISIEMRAPRISRERQSRSHWSVLSR
jgi:hypothetical protein